MTYYLTTKILLKQDNKNRSAKELPVFFFKMPDSVHQGGSRWGRGLGFGRRGWLVFRGWWSRSWGRLRDSWCGWGWSELR